MHCISNSVVLRYAGPGIDASIMIESGDQDAPLMRICTSSLWSHTIKCCNIHDHRPQILVPGGKVNLESCPR